MRPNHLKTRKIGYDPMLIINFHSETQIIHVKLVKQQQEGPFYQEDLEELDFFRKNLNFYQIPMILWREIETADGAREYSSDALNFYIDPIHFESAKDFIEKISYHEDKELIYQFEDHFYELLYNYFSIRYLEGQLLWM